jgi:hypothetical protein
LRSALVALDRVRVAGGGLFWIEAVLAQGAALAKEVPGAVEASFDFLETGMLVVAEGLVLSLVTVEQTLLLLDQLVDATEDLLVIHAGESTRADR